MIHSARNYLWVSLYYEINIKGFKEPYMWKGANIDWDELLVREFDMATSYIWAFLLWKLL